MKPALTLEKQMELLASRGLTWSDPSQVRQFLHDHSYYRFSGYLRYFQRNPGRGDNLFRPGSSFEAVRRIYVFDDELRRWLFDGLCILEVTFRARFAYALALGLATPEAYLNASTYSSGKSDNEPLELLERIKRDLDQSREPYIVKFNRSGESVPVWAALEVCSFGTVSKMFELISDPDLVKPVAKSLGLPFTIAAGTLQSLSVLRNICAHHGRIWNRVATVAMPVKANLKTEPDRVYHRTPWAWVVALGDLVDRIQRDGGSSDLSFSVGLHEFLNEYQDLHDGLKDPRTT
ncbi:Abi family protein [Nocardia sp. NPDC057353]|uniref:Abi family protein n=1 Tax=Nocardia sp. NPDC057353 TaxID=3346104 RepID=UPI00363F4C63